jgi:hypothetical protein
MVLPDYFPDGADKTLGTYQDIWWPGQDLTQASHEYKSESLPLEPHSWFHASSRSVCLRSVATSHKVSPPRFYIHFLSFSNELCLAHDNIVDWSTLTMLSALFKLQRFTSCEIQHFILNNNNVTITPWTIPPERPPLVVEVSANFCG